MGLREQQNLLARLYTDTDFSAAFFADPSGLSTVQGLSLAEADEMMAAARDEIHFFARSLISKRLRAVEKLLPLTCRHLERDLRPLFEEFAKEFNPTSTKKHLEDAMEFSAFIGRSTSIEASIKDVARFESATLRHHSHGRRITTCFVTHDLRPLLKSAQLYDIAELPKRRSLAVWFRLRGRTRFLFL